MKKISWNFLSVFLVLKCFDDIYAAEVKESSDDDDDFTIDLTPFGSKIFGSPIASDKNDTKENQNAQQSGNPEESGPYLEGDLLMPSSARNGMRAESYRWRNGEIPFVIQGSFSEFNKTYQIMNKSTAILCFRRLPDGHN